MSKIGVLRLAIEEQRRTHDELGDDLDSLQTKILTILGGSLALAAYLYAGGSLFIPEQEYGKIVYFGALILFLGAIYGLILAVKPGGIWEVPTEVKELKKLLGADEAKYLEYLKERYINCFENNVKVYSVKHRFLNMSFSPLVLGGIILVVLKSFGG